MRTACGVREPGRRCSRRSSPGPAASGPAPSKPCSTSGSATWMRCSRNCAPRERTWPKKRRTWRVSAGSAGSPILRAIGSSCGSPPDRVFTQAVTCWWATSRPLLDDFRVQELSDELDAKTGIGSGVLGVKLELGVGEVEPVGVDHDARRADDEQLAVHHVCLDSQHIRGDHRAGEVEGDLALLRAKLDARGYRPAPLPYVPAAVLLGHEYVFALGCGRDRQVGGELGQLAERPGGQRALQPDVEFLGAESAVAAGDTQRIHDAVAIRVRC